MAFRLKDINKLVQSASGWLGLLPVGGFMTAAYYFVARRSEWLASTNWADRTLIAIGLALPTMLLFVAVLALWRVWHPKAEQNLSEAKTEWKDLNLHNRLVGMEGLARTLEEAFSKFVVSNADKLDAFSDLISKNDTENAKSATEVRLLKDDLSKLRRAHDLWTLQRSEDMEGRFKGVDQGFAAILDRERMKKIETFLFERAKSLSGPTRGESMGDFDEWQKQESEWRDELARWCQLARPYKGDVYEKVHATSEISFRGNWNASDDLFPGVNAILAWRTFRVILSNFSDNLPLVRESVSLAAFSGPSTKYRGPVPRGADQMPLLPPNTGA